jgi:hypothetical protein
MREPATALTDFLLAVLAAVFLLELRRRGRSPLVGAQLFFGGFGLAALLGGIEHGFLVGDASAAQRVTWWLTITFTGVAACGLGCVGLERLGLRDARSLLAGAGIFVVSFGVYAWSDSRFVVSVLVSGAGSALCLVGLLRHALRVPQSGAVWAAAGLLISVTASVLQQRRLAVHPIHFDHNATYHLFLIPALGLFYAGNLRIATRAET